MTLLLIQQQIFLEAIQYERYHPDDVLQGMDLKGSDVILHVLSSNDALTIDANLEKKIELAVEIKDYLLLEAIQYEGYHPDDELQEIKLIDSNIIIHICQAKEPEFSQLKMEKLAQQDVYILSVFKHMSMRNPQLPAVEIWRPIFNANVLEDSVYQSIYATL